jgi:hypothetical protein
MFGTRTVPPPVPKPFVQYPWNPWTYEGSFATESADQVFKIRVQEIMDDLKVKLVLPNIDNLKLKIQSAQVWCTASGLVYPSLRAEFYELNADGGVNAISIRSTQSDKGTLNMPAKAGYKYPVSDAKDVLNSSDTLLDVVAASASGVGSNLTFRVQMLWQVRPNTSVLALS